MAGSKSDKFPYLPIDVDRLTSDELVEAMSTEEFGAYFLLLCKAWKSLPAGTIPNDDTTLARWARMSEKQWAQAKKRVLAPWKDCGDGRLSQKRLQEVHAEVTERVNKLKQAGAKGGKAKANKTTPENPSDALAMLQRCSSDATAMLQHRHQIATSDASSIQGSDCLANDYQGKGKGKEYISSIEEIKPPTPFFDFEGCVEANRTIVGSDGQTVLYEENYILWEFEFIRKWNKLPGVAKYSSKMLSDLERRQLCDRLKEHDWDWKTAFTMFPVRFANVAIGWILAKGRVQSVLIGNERILSFATAKPSKPKVDPNASINAIRERLSRENQTADFGSVFECDPSADKYAQSGDAGNPDHGVLPVFE